MSFSLRAATEMPVANLSSRNYFVHAKNNPSTHLIGEIMRLIRWQTRAQITKKDYAYHEISVDSRDKIEKIKSNRRTVQPISSDFSVG